MSFCDVMWCLELIFKCKYFVSWTCLVEDLNTIIFFGNHKMIGSILESVVN